MCISMLSFAISKAYLAYPQDSEINYRGNKSQKECFARGWTRLVQSFTCLLKTFMTVALYRAVDSWRHVLALTMRQAAE